MEEVLMGAKNNDMDSYTKIHLPATGNNEHTSAKQNGWIGWFNFRTYYRLYSKKMGEITGKFLLNILGITTAFWAFISNLPNPISVLLGIVSLMWATYRMLKERENWLMRRSERRKHEKDNNTNDI